VAEILLDRIEFVTDLDVSDLRFRLQAYSISPRQQLLAAASINPTRSYVASAIRCTSPYN
jgi:hypothetical protein